MLFRLRQKQSCCIVDLQCAGAYRTADKAALVAGVFCLSVSVCARVGDVEMF